MTRGAEILRCLVFALAGLSLTPPTWAQSPEREQQQAHPIKMERTHDPETRQAEIAVNLSDALSKRQLDTLKSAFTTFSNIAVYFPPDAKQPVAKKACAVRVDLWEEVYYTTVSGTHPQTQSLPSFADYARRCLRLSLPVATFGSDPAPEIAVSLVVEQISSEQAEQIRSWLIDQQSVAMQGLFAHMLGDLQMKEESRWRLRVQIKDKTSGHKPAR